MQKTKTDISDATFFVCDVETTGLSPVYNRLTEISILKIQNGEILDKFTSLINPLQHIPREITNLTGISNETVINMPSFKDIAPKITAFLKSENTALIFTGHNVAFDFKFLFHSFEREGVPFEMKTLCTCKLARRLLKGLKSKSLINVATHFGIKFKRQHRAYDDALATSKILVNFLQILNDEYEFDSVEEILKFQNCKIYNNENKSPVLKRLNLSLKDFPKVPGVYFMKSRSGEIIYIGKAKNLRERLSSYFRYNSELPVKLKKLLNNIRAIEYEVTNSELSALILESRLIKEHKPRFNSAIKRFRFHPFLKIDVQNSYPRIERVYEIENDGANYYGPFRSGMTVLKLMKDIGDEFKLRKCEDKRFKPSKEHSTCMYHEFGKCNAPCNFTQSHQEYRDEVMRVHEFITSLEKHSAQRLYEIRMNDFAESMDYERAAFIRDRLNDIRKVMSYQKVITSAINDKKIIIKCRSENGSEIFFIQNGKLVKTYQIRNNDEEEYNQANIYEELTETTEYLFFSLSKYVQHKFSNFEKDEIKVISNWLALNRDRNSFLEINEQHTKEDVMKFLVS
ncbi:MAG TPA: exonuclease domain-containing protein [Ignavibacteria bacterium]|nr:exonuclease domain-containing protein [Ignavibacteria bacterium]